MPSSQSPKRRHLVVKNPDQNPYVTELEQFNKYIWTDDPQEIGEYTAFLEGSLVLDLGCGSGNFLRDAARAFPERHFLGFELRYKRLVLGARKLKKWGIENVRLVQARAEEIDEWFSPNQLYQVHVNFPDPWPKKRQRKHRLIQEPFLEKLNQLLTKDGNFQFKTDHKEYFEEVLGLIKDSKWFSLAELSWDLHNSEFKPNNIDTEFEKLFLSKGLPVYYLKAFPKG